MRLHVALVTDAIGNVAHVWGRATTWKAFEYELLQIGIQVLDDHSEDWAQCTDEEIKEDCMSVAQLLTHDQFQLPRQSNLSLGLCVQIRLKRVLAMIRSFLHP